MGRDDENRSRYGHMDSHRRVAYNWSIASGRQEGGPRFSCLGQSQAQHANVTDRTSVELS